MKHQQSSNRNIRSVTVFGGRGMLGSDLTELLHGRGYRVSALDLPECDITKPD
ncbi:MAG: hypothetical protein EOM14_15030, partial [Clostridia bacterium]|nr:hypothetical protein [Clostridia bacterium]